VRRAAILLVLGLAAPAAADSFKDSFVRPIAQPIGEALADSVGRTLPLTAASAGVTFRFDKETHAFERETEVLGQLFLERPRPLGRGRWNLSVSYQWVSLDTADGLELDELADTRLPIIGPFSGRLQTVPRFEIDLETSQVTTSVTWGATDDLDLNLTLPVVYSEFGLRAMVTDLATGRSQRDRVHLTKTGPGDLFLRGKHRLVHGRWGDLAAGLVLRVPTGNEDNFQGTGTWEVSPMLYAATPSLAFEGGLRLQAYANAGVDLNADDVDASPGRIGVGLDCAFGERLTLAAAVLGREPFAAIAAPGFFDVTRVDPATGRLVRAPILGLERDRASAWDLSLGGRVNLWRDTVFGFANVLLPLNRDGFRSDVIPLVGVEAAF
jgi:hypothetical protein